MELVLDDIKVVYHRRGQETHAVRGVSLRARRGETLAIVGESGSGKTTIAKVAAGLHKATAGTVTWHGPSSNGSRAGRVQMVFQHPMQSLDPLWRIGRAVQEPLGRAGLPSGRARELAAEMIEQVGLDTSFLDRYPGQLSGGQAQRVAIARALISDPDIVILDEPTASLDQTVRVRILTLLARLQEGTGIGYMMITHDISSVRRLATRVAVMYRGSIVESGPAPAIFDGARHPYTRALIGAVPVADPRVIWNDTVDRDAAVPEETCPVGGTPCAQHGAGLHPIGPEHLVACTAR